MSAFTNASINEFSLQTLLRQAAACFLFPCLWHYFFFGSKCCIFGWFRRSVCQLTRLSFVKVPLLYVYSWTCNFGGFITVCFLPYDLINLFRLLYKSNIVVRLIFVAYCIIIFRKFKCLVILCRSPNS